MSPVRSIAALAAGLLLTAPALAQTTVTRSETVATGKTVRLAIVPNLKKDCSAGPMPEIRVSGAPKNGSLITKVGKIKTPASYRCPGKDAAVQAVFYQSKAGFTGSDEVTVDVKDSDGTIQTQNIKITVDAAKKDAPAKSATEL
ncbi:4-aminobutyrate aminotransferase [Methylobacterium sp. BTF04]|uniref:4-aminobutyrate aminotransferase n=1 Tax=Methylobacterium sp. BTF04 TaxID=2708300 RepID=UPI0013D77C16|nr:4-aminobutyrate aminotransferase [Methylobacterium sp. BTF04]NEU10924.1 4-aminobutyrate aminotransferase [Methylobacterium sp. BTF04]